MVRGIGLSPEKQKQFFFFDFWLFSYQFKNVIGIGLPLEKQKHQKIFIFFRFLNFSHQFKNVICLPPVKTQTKQKTFLSDFRLFSLKSLARLEGKKRNILCKDVSAIRNLLPRNGMPLLICFKSIYFWLDSNFSKIQNMVDKISCISISFTS